MLFVIFVVSLYYWSRHLFISTLKKGISPEMLSQKLHQFYIQYALFIGSFAFVVLLFFALSFYVFYKTSKELEVEINKLMAFLKDLTKKRKNDYIKSTFSQEFADIAILLTKVAKILSKQYKQKQAYTKKLELSNTQKDEIISAISHEFKNPIAVINGYSETLMDNELPDDLRKKFISQIYKNGKKLTKLIDTLRFAVRLDQSKQKVVLKNVDIIALLYDVIENLNATYDRDIKLISNTKTLMVKADDVLMDIVFSNLIENGIKYSDDKIEIVVDKNSVSVIDSGIGIKEQDISKITKKFYRVSENGWNNSLGLGLFIVLNILKLHNFELQIKSKLHEGSEFKIIFGEEYDS